MSWGPQAFGHWDGTLDRIHGAFYAATRQAAGREASPTAAIIDSKFAKAAQKRAPPLTRRRSTRVFCGDPSIVLFLQLRPVDARCSLTRVKGGRNELDDSYHLRNRYRHGSDELRFCDPLIEVRPTEKLSDLRFVVLGSAAGGGVPQWNCACPICALAWSGDTRVTRRTQSSVALTVDGARFALVNASPDLRQQIIDNPDLHPRAASRHSPITAAIVTNADVDHVVGLLSLRERHPFSLHATAATLATLRANAIFNVLAQDCVERRPIALNVPFAPLDGLEATAFALPGKVALWLEGDKVEIGGESEATIGLEFSAGGRRAIYAPGCAGVTDALLERVEGADILFFDGTTFTDDEMIVRGLSQKSARRMGHTPMSGEDGAIARFARARVGRKIFIHINNSNPALVAGSPERRLVEEAGWELAADGMEIVA